MSLAKHDHWTGRKVIKATITQVSALTRPLWAHKDALGLGASSSVRRLNSFNICIICVINANPEDAGLCQFLVFCSIAKAPGPRHALNSTTRNTTDGCCKVGISKTIVCGALGSKHMGFWDMNVFLDGDSSVPSYILSQIYFFILFLCT